MRRHMTYGLLLFMLVSGLLHAAPPTTVKIAILADAGDRTPKAGVVELLEVGLAAKAEWTVLDREHIARVLAEHELMAAGMLVPKQSIKMGLLLDADCMLFVEGLKSKAGKASLHRFRCIEALTGIVLCDVFLEIKEAGLVKDAIIDALREVPSQLAAPQRERRYVSLLGYSSEHAEDDPILSPRVLNMLVARELSRAEDVILLDREHLQLLQREVFLTGKEREYAISAYHIEGLIRASGGASTNGVDIQTVVRPIQGNAFPVIRSPYRASGTEEPWKGIARSIIDQIGGVAGQEHAGDRVKESEELRTHAATLKRYGEVRESVTAYEAAYILAPSASLALAISVGLKGSVGGYPEGCVVEEEQKRRDLRILIRSLRFWQEYMDEKLKRSRGQIVNFRSHRHTYHNLGKCWKHLAPGDEETRSLYDELRILNTEAYQTEIEYCREHWPKHHYPPNKVPGSTRFFNSLFSPHEVNDLFYMAVTGEEYASVMKTRMRDFIEMPGYTSDYLAFLQFSGPYCMTLQCLHLTPYGTPEGGRALIDLCKWLQAQDSYPIKIGGYFWEFSIIPQLDSKRDARIAALNMLDCLETYYRTGRRNPGNTPNLMVRKCLSLLDSNDPDKSMTKRYFDMVLEVLDARTFVSWYHSDAVRWNSMLKGAGKDYYAQWLRSAIGKLPPRALAAYRSKILQRSIDATYNELEQKYLLLDTGGTVAPPEQSVHWSSYDIDQVSEARTECKLALFKRQGDAILMAWVRPVDDAFELRVSVADLRGRPLWESPPFLCRDAVKGASLEVADAALCNGTVYVAVRGVGLIRASARAISLMGTGTGLAHADILSLAAFGDRLFLGYAKDYLQVLSAVDGTLTELAYSRSNLRRNPLDGCKTRFAVNTLLADEEADSVWMITSTPNATWRIDSVSNTVVRVAKGRRGLLTCNDGRILCSADNSLAALASNHGHWERIGLHGQTLYTTAPHLVMARDVLSAGAVGNRAIISGGNTFQTRGRGGLYLHKKQEDKAFRHTSMDGVDFMVRTGRKTALLASKTGQIWGLKDSGEIRDTLGRDGSRESDREISVLSYTNELDVIHVAASSHAQGDGITLSPAMAVDANPNTCWAAATNDVNGAWISFEFSKPGHPACIRFINGWIPSPDEKTMYPRNHRPKSIALTTDAGERVTFELEDHNDPQFVKLDLEAPTRVITLTTTDVYESEVINPVDPPWLNISEVLFFEKPGTQATSAGVHESPQSVAALKHQQGEE